MAEDLDKLRKEGYTQMVTPKNPDFNPNHINFNKGLEELSIKGEGVFCAVENFKVVETKNHPITLANFSSKYVIYIKPKAVETYQPPKNTRPLENTIALGR